MFYNKGLILQGNIPVVSVYLPNMKTQQAEAEAEELQGETHSVTSAVHFFQ